MSHQHTPDEQPLRTPQPGVMDSLRLLAEPQAEERPYHRMLTPTDGAATARMVADCLGEN